MPGVLPVFTHRFSGRPEKIDCGLDGSKKNLAAGVKGKTVRWTNTTEGIQRLRQQAGDVHYVFESTGGSERLAAWILLAKGCTVSLVNPGRVRDSAKSLGQLAQTDAIDAAMITQFAQSVHPQEAAVPSEPQRALSAWVERRQQRMTRSWREKNRLDTTSEAGVRSDMEKPIQSLTQPIDPVEKQIDPILQEMPEMKAKAQRIPSIKGLGPICAATRLALLPEMGELSRGEMAALAGVAPYHRDRGAFRGQRHIHGGRKRLRACLYMAAVCASHSNPHLKEFYHRLVETNPCPKKVALVAVMRKRLMAANSAVKNPHFLVA